MAISGVGAIFNRWNNSTGDWEAIAGIYKISQKEAVRDTIDKTPLHATGGFRTFASGYRSSGVITLGMDFARNMYELLLTDFDDDALHNYQISIPGDEAMTLEFEGAVVQVPLSVPPDDRISTDIGIRVHSRQALEHGWFEDGWFDSPGFMQGSTGGS